MKIECSQCKKIYHIPDDRLPKDRAFAFPCKACKTIIAVDFNENQSVAPKRSVLPSGEELKKKILRTVRDLPPMPQTVFKAREIMSDPNSNFKTLAKVLETDPAIVTRILKLANSAYYGFVGKVTSIQHAVMVLGQKTLSEIVTMAGSQSILGKEMKGYGLDAGELWQHSLSVAFGSKMIAGKKEPCLEEDAFAAGLIHDVGKIVLDSYLVERLSDFQQALKKSQQSFLTAEKEILGFDHAEIAAELCKSWNIADHFAVAIRFHHEPSRSSGSSLAHFLHLADIIALMSGLGIGIDGMQYHVDGDTLNVLGIGEDDINQMIGEVTESVWKVTEELQYKI